MRSIVPTLFAGAAVLGLCCAQTPHRPRRETRTVGCEELAAALVTLGSESADLRDAARRKLRAAGETGRLFLRRALLEEEGRIAVEALELLVELGDQSVRPIIVERITTAQSEGFKETLAHALHALSGADDLAEVTRRSYQIVARDTSFEHRALAGFLCREYTERLSSDAERFNAMIGDPGALDRLRSYVNAAMRSTDEAFAMWAARFAPEFGLVGRGLRGQYYAGQNFEKLVLERLDAGINVPDRRFPYPDGRQDEISVRWTGFIEIPRSGRYVFYSASDDGQRLWVNDRQLIDDWTYHGVVERSAEIQLPVGRYPFKVEYMQGGGGASIRVSWSGPGIAKQVIPGSAFFTAPWR